MNLIPYLFYDLTEKKHRGYVNVLKIRTMFEDYGNGELEDNQLVDAMKIIKASQGPLDKKKVDKSALKLAKQNKDKEAIARAKADIRETKKHNEFVEGLPIVVEELEKFGTERYKAKLVSAKNTVEFGEIYLYSDWKEEMAKAKQMPKNTDEEKEIRSDAMQLAREKKRSAKLLAKYGKENLVLPDEKVVEEIKSRDYNTEKERRQIKKDLKAYTDGVSVYRRITKPYSDAKNLIIQAENYAHLAEIEELYESVKCK
jgi:hypothetical protein